MNTQTKNTYLYFQVGDEYFAIHISKIKEVVDLPKIKIIPKSPDFLLGLSYNSGKIIPIIDFSLKMGLGKLTQSKHTPVIVVSYSYNGDTSFIGLVVNRVLGIISITKQTVKNFPKIGSKYKLEYLDGVLGYDDKFILILNLDNILSDAESEIIKQTVEDVKQQSQDNSA